MPFAFTFTKSAAVAADNAIPSDDRATESLLREARSEERGDGDAQEDADDQHHHHEFDEREAALIPSDALRHDRHQLASLAAWIASSPVQLESLADP